MIHISTFGPLLENLKKQEIQDIKNIFRGKACFRHNIAYGGFKYLAIRAQTIKFQTLPFFQRITKYILDVEMQS